MKFSLLTDQLVAPFRIPAGDVQHQPSGSFPKAGMTGHQISEGRGLPHVVGGFHRDGVLTPQVDVSHSARSAMGRLIGQGFDGSGERLIAGL